MEENQNGFIRLSKEVKDEIDETMPPEEEMQDLAEFFKVFGDATRLKILYALKYSEMCVLDIANLLKMNQSAISHQLRVLKQMDLVRSRREGKAIFYALQQSPFGCTGTANEAAIGRHHCTSLPF